MCAFGGRGGGAGQWIWHHHYLSRIILMEIFFLQQLTPLHIYCNINASYLNILPTLLLICSNAHGKQGIGICGGDRRLNRTAFCFCLFPLWLSRHLNRRGLWKKHPLVKAQLPRQLLMSADGQCFDTGQVCGKLKRKVIVFPAVTFVRSSLRMMSLRTEGDCIFPKNWKPPVFMLSDIKDKSRDLETGKEREREKRRRNKKRKG